MSAIGGRCRNSPGWSWARRRLSISSRRAALAPQALSRYAARSAAGSLTADLKIPDSGMAISRWRVRNCLLCENRVRKPGDFFGRLENWMAWEPAAQAREIDEPLLALRAVGSPETAGSLVARLQL